jgi:hypothetical protein
MVLNQQERIQNLFLATELKSQKLLPSSCETIKSIIFKPLRHYRRQSLAILNLLILISNLLSLNSWL